MALVFNGVTIPDNSANALTFNGSDVTQVVFNGTTVWQQSLFLDTQTVTVGVNVSQYVDWYGYSNSINLGSISDGTSNIYGGASILQIANLNGNSTILTIEGSRANSGWTTMTINGIDFNRADASYSTTTTNTAWTWSPSSNPFGTTEGAEVTVTWI